MRQAVKNEEFVLHYQPKVQLNGGYVVGLEALLRWDRPGHGLVPPGEFIYALEESGLIVDVGRWVIAKVCEQLRDWIRAGLDPVQVSVNVSERQFVKGDLEGDVLRAVDAYDIPTGLLELELTETLLMTNPDRTIAILENLKAAGVEISVDDFGTGYSSLAYLRKFPIDKLKIDRSFISDIFHDPNEAAIALAIIRLGHSLDLVVIAEGVETAAQLEYLRRHKCDQIQGFYFSRPLPVPELEQLLLAGTSVSLPDREGSEPPRNVLLVADTKKEVAALQLLLGASDYRVLTAVSATECFELLALHEVRVIVYNERIPGMARTDFLGRIRELHPSTLQIVLSATTDFDRLRSNNGTPLLRLSQRT